MNDSKSHSAPHAGLVVLAFATVYLVWGSTYLGIRYAVETIPPFLMGGSRFMVAGLFLLAWAWRKGVAWPTLRQWRDTTIVGVLLLVGGNGSVTWAEQMIPSGVAALLLTTTPLWMVLLEWWETKGPAPSNAVRFGLLFGFAGVTLLVLKGEGYGGEPLPWIGVAVLFFATVCWSGGSLFSRHSDKPRCGITSVALQMVMGGLVMSMIGVGAGELGRFEWSSVSVVSIQAWLYLTFIGSLAGFPAYIWLLQVSTPSRVSTHAFVNPMIAVLLGCTLGREPFNLRMLIATALILGAVILIMKRRSHPPTETVKPAGVNLKAEPCKT